MITIYTDGSCNNNSQLRRGGYCAVIVNEDTGVTDVVAGQDKKNSSSNRMELMAVITGLTALPLNSDVKVLTDSQYVSRGVNEYWEKWEAAQWKTSSGAPVKNLDLWLILKHAIFMHAFVEVSWVKAHSGIWGNEHADHVAKLMSQNKVLEANEAAAGIRIYHGAKKVVAK